LTFRTTSEQLKKVFEKFGDIGDVYIPRDHRTKESRGFAFVRFYERDDAEDAMDELDGHMLDGRPLRVQVARYARPDRDPRRDRGGGGRYGGRGYRDRYRSRSRSRSRDRRRRSRSRSRDRRRRRSKDRSRSKSGSPRDRSKSPRIGPKAPRIARKVQKNDQRAQRINRRAGAGPNQRALRQRRKPAPVVDQDLVQTLDDCTDGSYM